MNKKRATLDKEFAKSGPVLMTAVSTAFLKDPLDLVMTALSTALSTALFRPLNFHLDQSPSVPLRTPP